MKYSPYYTKRIKKQLALLKKRGYKLELFREVVEMLIDGIPLPPKYCDHKPEHIRIFLSKDTAMSDTEVPVVCHIIVAPMSTPVHQGLTLQN